MATEPVKCLCCRRSTGRTVFLVVFMGVYLVLGATIFSLIESPTERTMINQLKDHRRDFMWAHNNCVSDEEFEDFIAHVVRAAERGVSAIGNVSGDSNWSMGQSIFFAATVLTTIGYGHTTPLSQGGKVFCIIYALVGIPLTLVLFTAFVERLMIPSTRVLQYMFSRHQRHASAFGIRLIHLAGVVILILVFVFLIPAAVFTALEPNWDYLDAVYYCFISLSTIGLGDYIPGESRQLEYRALYKIMTTIYLFCGLTLMMFLLAVIYEIPELNLGLHFYMQSDVAHDEERLRLKSSSEGNDTKYTEDQQPSDVEKKPLDDVTR